MSSRSSISTPNAVSALLLREFRAHGKNESQMLRSMHWQRRTGAWNCNWPLFLPKPRRHASFHRLRGEELSCKSQPFRCHKACKPVNTSLIQLTAWRSLRVDVSTALLTHLLLSGWTREGETLRRVGGLYDEESMGSGQDFATCPRGLVLRLSHAWDQPAGPCALAAACPIRLGKEISRCFVRPASGQDCR
ncbi:hypothetical protein BU26DRAFT_46067 [Trematosphaeria pertusa]|uniref:Uncharacterized protein n=1 Tax=Trematosphaeria pertusa TaxID=390896 RepID=A0A6A6IAE6_9PLEO|nr:uncharacterized protein BU26DRAFT_46067 [Trematosphaeria pertusa]KAF2246463.1 hypothetical protein BU26DRAFT_46067 [Trematosphaeria pertusa]